LVGPGHFRLRAARGRGSGPSHCTAAEQDRGDALQSLVRRSWRIGEDLPDVTLKLQRGQILPSSDVLGVVVSA